MGIATKIPQNTFNGIQTDAGVLVWTFDPTTPSITDSNIICATTGGVTASCKPTYSDMGEDVDNCPNNMKELKHLDGWDCVFSTTGLGTSLEAIRLALGAADVTSASSKVTPRRNLQQSDFKTLWWVGDRADGGLVAIKLMNALSTGGFELKTEKNGKGQISIELTGHVSINSQNVMPMEFYSLSSSTAHAVEQILTNVTSNFDDYSIANNGELEVTLTAASGYTIANVVVLMGGVDVTSSKWNSSTGKVTISAVTGDVVIIATANVTG